MGNAIDTKQAVANLRELGVDRDTMVRVLKAAEEQLANSWNGKPQTLMVNEVAKVCDLPLELVDRILWECFKDMEGIRRRVAVVGRSSDREQ